MPTACPHRGGARSFAAVWRLHPPESRIAGTRPLRRRGILHGHLEAVRDAGAGDAATVDVGQAFAAAEPIALPGILAPDLAAAAAEVEHSQRLFEHLRQGGRFLEVVLAALADAPHLRPEGSTVDRLDPREIEKVYVSGVEDGRRVRGGRDVWAKLQWIAHDERDLSLRVRFSCGTEQLHDWQRNVEGQQWSDRFAELLFPEGRVLAQNTALLDLLEQLLGAPPRLSERIVYSNAPGGGAVFHHDADASQRGVAYGQLAGATAWLALPAGELAAQVAACAAAQARADLPATAELARRRLDREDDTALFHLLNEDTRFTARLAEAGWLTVLEPGDALLLPSHDRDRTAWHSVFALGEAPSLAHSYGVFT